MPSVVADYNNAGLAAGIRFEVASLATRIPQGQILRLDFEILSLFAFGAQLFDRDGGAAVRARCPLRDLAMVLDCL